LDDSRARWRATCRKGFNKLREALKPLVGDLSRVVYVSYAIPRCSNGGALAPAGAPASTFTPLSTPTRSGWQTSSTMCRTNSFRN